MASWRNIKWDGNETLGEFSYRVTQLGKGLGLNDQHILDTFKLGLPSNTYVNLVPIDIIQATLNMVKDLCLYQKEILQVQVSYQVFPSWQFQVMMGWFQACITSLTYPNK